MRADEAGRLEIDTTEKLIKMMDEALIKGEVSQNEAKGESGTKKKYNLTQYSERQIENWKSSKNIVVYENEQQYRNFIRQALSGSISGKKYTLAPFPLTWQKIFMTKPAKVSITTTSRFMQIILKK